MLFCKTITAFQGYSLKSLFWNLLTWSLKMSVVDFNFNNVEGLALSCKWSFLVLPPLKSRRDVFFKKYVLRNFAKFTGKHLRQSLYFDKVAGMRTATLLKERLWNRCFRVNFAKFLRTPFLQKTSGGYFWKSQKNDMKFRKIKVNKSVHIAKWRQRYYKTLNNIFLDVPNHALKDVYMLNYGTIKNTKSSYYTGFFIINFFNHNTVESR